MKKILLMIFMVFNVAQLKSYSYGIVNKTNRKIGYTLYMEWPFSNITSPKEGLAPGTERVEKSWGRAKKLFVSSDDGGKSEGSLSKLFAGEVTYFIYNNHDSEHPEKLIIAGCKHYGNLRSRCEETIQHAINKTHCPSDLNGTCPNIYLN